MDRNKIERGIVGQIYSQFSFLCIMCTVCVQMCDVLLPPGVNPTAVKYIYIYIISYVWG
jgi:hypothetical protein